MNQQQSATLQQNLTAHVNANARISAYCDAIVQTTVQSSPGAWYAPFMTQLAVAQQHAALYSGTIGPDAFTTIPTALVQYGQNYQASIAFIQNMVAEAKLNPLTAKQISEVQQIFQQLHQTLTSLLGTSTDTNLPVNGGSAPAQLTIYGCRNDLNTFNDDITNDNGNLVTGKKGAVQEVGLLQGDETNINNDIETLQAEIEVFNTDISVAEAGIGVSIFVAVVGLALAIPTGGGSLVATGFGVAGLGGSIAVAVIYTKKVEAAQKKVAADQAELTTDKQQVAQLQAIIVAVKAVSKKNTDAQTALGAIVEVFDSLITESNTTLADLQKADSDQIKGLAESAAIKDALSAWGDVIGIAQGILNSNINKQTLTAPQLTA